MINQTFGQVTWETFNEPNDLFYIEIPSNWNSERVPIDQQLAPIDYTFRYADKGDAFAWIELLISESSYFNARDAVQSYISGYQQYPDFRLIQPMECNTFTLNDMPACSFVTSFQLEGEKPRTVLTVLSLTEEGIQTEAVFVASNNIYDIFLPAGEYAINSISIKSSKVNEIFGIPQITGLQSELPPIPPSQTIDSNSNVPQIPSQTNQFDIPQSAQNQTIETEFPMIPNNQNKNQTSNINTSSGLPAIQ